MGTYVQLKQEDYSEEDSDVGMMSTVISSGKASSLSVEEVLKQFRSDPLLGLNNDEVERRRKLHGLNEFDAVEDTPLWRKYIDQVWSLLYMLDRWFTNHVATTEIFTQKNLEMKQRIKWKLQAIGINSRRFPVFMV